MEQAGDLARLTHISKIYPGAEVPLRGTKLEWRGPALWGRNLLRAARLTSSAAAPVHALRDVSLSITAGQIYGLVGANGSGKTTLIKILAGLIRPTSGVGHVAGVSLEQPSEIRRRVSYVSTTGWMGLEWALNAEENVRYFATLCGMPGALARARTEAALRDADLWADRHKYPSQLSNGMRQRVMLARALLFYTPLVLLDEPTVGLDPLTVQETLKLFQRLCVERGQTILLTDHRAAEMEQIASHIAVLADGEIALSGTPAQLRESLHDVSVIEVHTEEMEPPTAAAPNFALAVEQVERPGALSVRSWRVYAWKAPDTLDQTLRWLTQSTGSVIFVAERAPSLHDVLVLPHAEIAARRASLASEADGQSGTSAGERADAKTAQEVEAR